MTKHNVTLDGLYDVRKGPRDKSWSATVSISLDALTTDMVERLALHGLHQKIADAASGATNADEANAAMNKAADAILRGDWTSRVAGEGVDEKTYVARMVIRGALKASWGAKSPQWKAFDALTDAEQGAKLDKVRADNGTMFDEAIARKLAERAAARADRAELSKGLVIDI